MTFSQKVREELLVLDIEPETAKIELMAAFKAIGTIQIDYSSLMIEIKTSQIKLTKRLLEIIKHEYPLAVVQTLVRDMRSFNGTKKSYIIRIAKHAKEILKDLGLIDSLDFTFILSLNDISSKLKTQHQKRVYTRMYYCCLGTVNDPKNAQQYHLEINGSNELYLDEIKNITKKYSINFKLTKRKDRPSLYLNKSEEIADFLKFIMAVNVLFEFEDYRMVRDMMMVSNRLNNADIANEVKKMKTSSMQIDAINYLKQRNLIKTFGAKTIKVIELRLKYPEDSYQELSKHSEGLLSKSNIRYHLSLVEKRARLNK
ncbi:MAG: DNA-binding protein WhiA [Spiroplasma sp.]|nr:DNA-binding protein WhiA [Mycoplasmatales bacterium]